MQNKGFQNRPLSTCASSCKGRSGRISAVGSITRASSDVPGAGGQGHNEKEEQEGANWSWSA
eukprot:498558-Pyramimonas_sp.AAC.1